MVSTDLTHLTTAGDILTGDPIPTTRGGNSRNVRFRSAGDGVWFDIRDYGDISSGVITTALQATINAIGAAGKCKTILIPQVAAGNPAGMTQGAITLPDPTGDPGWTLIYACSRIFFDVTLSIPAGTTIRGDFGTGVRGNGIGARGPNGVHIKGDNIAVGLPVILMPKGTGSCCLENLTIEAGNGASYAMKMYRAAGLIIRNCNFSGSGNISGGRAAYAGLQPALLIDGSFWIQMYDSRFANEDGSSPAVWNRSIDDPTSDVGVGLFVAYNCCSAGGGGGIKLGPATYGSNAGNSHFDSWLHEDMTAGHSLLEIDATGNIWSDISLNLGSISDAAGPNYLLKTSGSSPTGSNLANVVLSNCNVILFDPASTPIQGLHVWGGRGGAGAGQTFVPVPTYNAAYSAEWPDIHDTVQVATPRGPQAVIGTVKSISQDGSGWSGVSATKTTGIRDPFGGTNAVKLAGASTGNAATMYSVNQSVVAGDWFIVGCWIQAVSGQSIGANSRTFSFEMLTGTLSHGDSIFRDDVNLFDGAWKWCCQPFKVFTVVGGTADIVITAVVNTSTFNYFNPCLQHIPASLGLTDGDVMNAARAYKGGWSPIAEVGDVSILPQQKLRGRLKGGIEGVWHDIRDFGDISSGNITVALQAALDTVGAAGTNKTIMIPQVIGIATMQQDAITIPVPSGDPGWTFLYACKRIQFTSPMSVPAATIIKGAFGSGVRGRGIGSRGPDGVRIVGDSIAAGSAIIIMDGPSSGSTVGSCIFENLTLEAAGGASYGLKILRTSGVIINDCNITGGTNTSGAHAALVGNQPGLLIDGSYWIQTYNCRVASGDGASPSIIARSIEDPTSDAGVGLCTMYNLSLAGGGIKLGPVTYGPSGGNCHFDSVVCEDLYPGKSLIEIDATGNAWNDISVRQAEIADPGGTVYMLKVTGIPNNVKFYNCGAVSIDPASTGFCTGLYIFGGPQGGGGGDRFTPIPTSNISYGRFWPDMTDARLVTAPRAPQWTIGQVRNVSQDGTAWVQRGSTAVKTPGQLAPDGSTNAIRISATSFSDGYDLYQTTINPVNVGDWFIVGCWVQSVSGSDILGNSKTLSLDFIWPGGGTATISADTNKIAQNDSGIIDGAWKWCCQAFKIRALGQAAGSTDIHINGSANTVAFNYFNPCMQYIPVATGIWDGDVMNYARSLKGGWAPQANLAGAGQLSILDHQSLRANIFVPPRTFATLPASPLEGMVRHITDSNTATHGATVAAGGTNKVMVWYNGTAWTVMGS